MGGEGWGGVVGKKKVGGERWGGRWGGRGGGEHGARWVVWSEKKARGTCGHGSKPGYPRVNIILQTPVALVLLAASGKKVT